MNILLISAAAIASFHAAAQSTTEPKLLRYPAVYENVVVFSYAGDLWIGNLSGGLSRRLTSAPGTETMPKISPDGKTIAFVAQYDGQSNIYTMPIEGGEPKRLTYDSEQDLCLGWTPSRDVAYATASLGPTHGRQARMFLVSPKGGLPRSTPLMEITAGSFFPDGKTVAYTRFNSYAFNWRRYRGGSQGKISIYNMATNTYSELPHGREQSYFPMVVGRSIYYTSDRNEATQNLYRYDLDKRSDTQITHFTDADVRYPSTDGKTIVYERNGNLYAYDVASGQTKDVAPKVPSENLAARPEMRSLASQISSISISPSGARVAVEARGEIFSVPAKAGDTRNITNSQGSRERFPTWSPDGKTIAYASDATGNYEVYVQPQLGGTPERLTNAKLDITGLRYSPDSKIIGITTGAHDLYILDVDSKRLTKVYHADYAMGGWDWSPDSKWIAYTLAGRNQLNSVYLYEISTGKATQVTDGYFNDSDVAFDQNGKYLYIVSARTFAPTYGLYEFSLKVDDAQNVYVAPLSSDTPNPLVAPDEEEPSQPATPPARTKPEAPAMPPTPVVKVDFERFSQRFVQLPLPSSSYSITSANNGVLIRSRAGTLSKFDLGTRQNDQLLTLLLGMYSFNPARTKLAYDMGGTLGVLDLHPGIAIGQGKVDTSSVETVVNPREEWRQMFWEAWRHERDHYYDPNMRGLDWEAIGKHYETFLPYVASRSDLNYVIGMMIGELGTGHSYVIGGDTGQTRPTPVGHLGVDYQVVGDHIRIAKIYEGDNYDESARSPLTEPGVNVHAGDYLLSIDGTPLHGDTVPESLMLDKANKFVTIVVNGSPTTEGARTVRVRPIASEMRLRAVDFIENNRRLVSKLSGGKLGYMYIEDTATQGAIDFIKGFFSQTDKEGIVVDERWNNGGYIQPWFVETLARKMQAGIQVRNGGDVGDAVAIEGPKAMLINGYSGSGGDFFPWMFRHNNLGPLIGKRTWGGLVGIDEQPVLVDGGIVTAPEFSIYDRSTGEIIAENHGVSPDIDVDARPDLVAKGEDPQLEAAVKYLMEQLQKNPPPPPRKKLPQVGKEGLMNLPPPSPTKPKGSG